MPNYVENHITLSGEQEQIDKLLNEVKDDDYGLGTIDFNKVRPMPKSLEIECSSSMKEGLSKYTAFMQTMEIGAKNMFDSSLDDGMKALKNMISQFNEYAQKNKDNWELGKTAYYNIKQYNCPTWYEWSINNWGTKWNACGYSQGTDYSSDSNQIWCQTAWSAPKPIIEKLSKMHPELTIGIAWADEDLGSNLGHRLYNDGDVIYDREFINEKERIEFAVKLWNCDLEDLGFVLNSDKTGYVNADYEDLKQGGMEL